jgi:hypothetical protein
MMDKNWSRDGSVKDNKWGEGKVICADHLSALDGIPTMSWHSSTGLILLFIVQVS